MFRIFQYSNPSDFLIHAGCWLEENECINCRVLGAALDQVNTKTDAQPLSSFFVVVSEDNIQCAAILSKDGLLDVSTASVQSFKFLLERLNLLKLDLRRVFLEESLVWQSPGLVLESLECRYFRKSVVRLYECRHVNTINMANGHLRLALPNELDQLSIWWCQFEHEVGHSCSYEDSRVITAERIRNQTVLVWEDGSVVSMACFGRSTKSGKSIFGVYTPPDLRRRNYATSCTAALTKRLFINGIKFCCLYADDKNATSNLIYQRIGYQLVTKMELWERGQET